MAQEQTTLPQEPVDRRDALEAAFENLDPPETTERARDDAGRFAASGGGGGDGKTMEVTVGAGTQGAGGNGDIPPAPPPEVRKLTTWKKDFLPLHEKLEAGLPLTADEAKRLAGYNHQRESEYSTGISSWKERATSLGSIEKAIEPFMPELQSRGIAVDTWISNLGRAHHTLALGTTEQKLQMFAQLAQQYGVPMGAVQQQAQGQVDPALMQVLEQMNQLSGQVKTVASFHEQQEQSRINTAIAEMEDTTKYPHFPEVRSTMAELLQSGLAPDLPTAYAKAVRLNDEVWAQEQARQSQASQAQAQSRQAVAQAKAAAVSVKSSAPSGTLQSAGPKDRRALLEAALEQHTGRV